MREPIRALKSALADKLTHCSGSVLTFQSSTLTCLCVTAGHLADSGLVLHKVLIPFNCGKYQILDGFMFLLCGQNGCAGRVCLMETNKVSAVCKVHPGIVSVL